VGSSTRAPIIQTASPARDGCVTGVAEARKELAHSRHEHNKAAVNVKVGDLKAKLQPRAGTSIR
jgi:hypothetical protein